MPYEYRYDMQHVYNFSHLLAYVDFGHDLL